jgi:hypothetical protein
VIEGARVVVVVELLLELEEELLLELDEVELLLLLELLDELELLVNKTSK